MKVIRSLLLGTIIGFCAIMFHNVYPPFGFIASIVLTFMGMNIVSKTFFYLRYQVLASAAWLAVVLFAGNPGSGNEVLVYGNTYGNIFLITGFITLVISLLRPRRLQN
jgi:uncharacterized membrane protein YeaQ/YmgE (transglycosylase-associated protein family)